MNSVEIAKLIEEKGLAAIRVTEFDDPKSISLTFDGDFSEFIDAAVRLGAKAIFFNSGFLSEDDFIYELGDSDNEMDEVVEGIDLEKIDKRIGSYKKYVNSERTHHFLAVTPNGNLLYHVQEKWWNEFLDIALEAIDKIQEESFAKFRSDIEKDNETQKSLIKKLRSLKNDGDFALCRTQKVKLAFALEKYPELEKLKPALLKKEISDMTAILEAKQVKR